MEKKKILIIDDQEIIRELIATLVPEDKYIIIPISDATKALEIATKVNPNLILLDIMMPKLNGLKLCSMFKNNEGLKGTPIIIVSSRGQKMDIKKGLEAGADDFLPKPFIPDELVEKIEVLTRQKT